MQIYTVYTCFFFSLTLSFSNKWAYISATDGKYQQSGVYVWQGGGFPPTLLNGYSNMIMLQLGFGWVRCFSPSNSCINRCRGESASNVSSLAPCSSTYKLNGKQRVEAEILAKKEDRREREKKKERQQYMGEKKKRTIASVTISVSVERYRRKKRDPYADGNTKCAACY